MSVPFIPHPTSGENLAADGHVDLSKLEVSLTLTNKFEGLEADADDTNAQSLLLRWVQWPPRPRANMMALRGLLHLLLQEILPEA
jgi:hypothetical protein